jgi:hypothetical protein
LYKVVKFTGQPHKTVFRDKKGYIINFFTEQEAEDYYEEFEKKSRTTA